MRNHWDEVDESMLERERAEATKTTPGRSTPRGYRRLTLRTRRERELAMLAAHIALRRNWSHRVATTVCQQDVLRAVGIAADENRTWTAAEVRAALSDVAQRLPLQSWPPNDALQRNIIRLGGLLGLDRVEQAIVRIGYLCEKSGDLRAFLEAVITSRVEWMMALKTIPALDVRTLRHACSQRGTLYSVGLLEVSPGRYDLGLVISSPLLEALDSSPLDTTALLRSLVRPAPRPQLSLGDYDHLPQLDQLRRYLGAFRTRRRRGVNVLLYGAPGTGKTELVRALAAGLGFSLSEVPNEDNDGLPISGQGRLRAYRLCQRLLEPGQGQAMILFDEIEDVFGRGNWLDYGVSDSSYARRRKSWVNELLETNPIPTVWVSNGIDAIDSAHVRRFDLVVHCRAPGRVARERIIAKHFRRGEISEECVRRLGGIDGLVPAHIARVARVMRKMGCSSVAQRDVQVLRIIEGTLTAMGYRNALRAPSLPAHYDPAFVNTTADLDALVAGLRRSNSARLCLYGPPGTGKTAFAHHLGRVLDKPVLVRRASELLSSWVGGTEALIAEAFQRANDDGAILVIDEADGFLRDRTAAQQSWEVTQVNELLTQMESFDGIFVASTNLIDTLDAAALRRFDFKLKYDYLRPEQRRALVRKVAIDGTDSEQTVRAWQTLDRLTMLTPGDVANALRQCAVTGQAVTVPTLVALLQAEQAIKPEGRQRSIGFTA
ncbi:MAG: AAA family ATPase [Dokdonella sp.]|nr:MAG: AAA family ATPase [Dokdonella sp.]